MSDWNDIASAPKDGTHIIVWYGAAGGPRSICAKWDTNLRHWITNDVWLAADEVSGWQSLPLPPSPAAPKEGE